LSTKIVTSGKVSPPALVLMLAVVFLVLLDAGFDNNAVHGVLIMLVTATMFFAFRNLLLLDLSFKQPLIWYILFLTWAGISIFWSINPHRTLVEFLQLASYGLAFLLAAALNRDNIIRVGRIVLITGFGVALFGLSQYLLLDSSRIESTLTNSNMFGIFMTMLFLFGWAYYIRQPNRYLAVVCITLLVALALSGSRGSIICLALALPLIFLGIQHNNLKPAVIRTLLCLAAAFLLTLLVIYSAPYLQGLFEEDTALARLLASKSTTISRSGMIRFAFWETGIKVALNEPIIGTGLGTFSLAYFIDYMEELYYSRFAHNHYIQTMTELGLIGLALLGGFVVTIVRLAWLKLKEKEYPLFVPGIIAALFAFLIHIGADFSWNFPGVSIVFFIMAGALVSVTSKRNVSIKQATSTTLIIVSLLILLLTAWQLTANLTYRQGLTYEYRGDYASAASIYDRANSFYPINSMAFSFASRNYYRLALQQEEPVIMGKAIKRAERAVELSPVDANLHNQLGWLYWRTGQLDKAEHHLETAAEYALYRLGLIIDLSRFYIQQERFAEAEKVINQGLEIKERARDRQRSDEDRVKVDEQIQTLYELSEKIKQD